MLLLVCENSGASGFNTALVCSNIRIQLTTPSPIMHCKHTGQCHSYKRGGLDI